ERPAYPRRYPIGAEVRPHGGVHFRVWAPRRKRVEVVLEGGTSGQAAYPLAAEAGGDFAGAGPQAHGSTVYRVRLGGGTTLYPDPASRFQPEGPHGPSQVIDSFRFQWTDKGWQGRGQGNEVLYELHVGTFTPEGTLAAAQQHLADVAALGVTIIELMP